MKATDYIPWIISSFAILVTLYSLFHKENQDKQNRSTDTEIGTQVAIAEIGVKLTMILESMNELKSSMNKQDRRLDSLTERVTKLEDFVNID